MKSSLNVQRRRDYNGSRMYSCVSREYKTRVLCLIDTPAEILQRGTRYRVLSTDHDVHLRRWEPRGSWVFFSECSEEMREEVLLEGKNELMVFGILGDFVIFGVLGDVGLGILGDLGLDVNGLEERGVGIASDKDPVLISGEGPATDMNVANADTNHSVGCVPNSG